MIYDCFLFHNELDILEIRLNVLDEYVDKFVLVESTETFSGLKKPLYYKDNKERFKKWEHKIIHHVVDSYLPEEWEEAKKSPNTGGLDHWCREFVQRENIKKPLGNCKDDDIIFIGDVDEIWEPSIELPPDPTEQEKEISLANGIGKLKLRVYSYYLNNRSDEEFWGTFVGKYGFIKDHSINHLRSNKTTHTVGYKGWHFTSMGGADNLRKKIESYGHQEFNNESIKSRLQERIDRNEDFIGRGFAYKTDESDWPQFLKDNKHTYKHLCANS